MSSNSSVAAAVAAAAAAAHLQKQPQQRQTARKISAEEIQLVQSLIERCLQLYMNQTEVITALHRQAKIEPGFTSLVWQKLEQQNPEFFKAYNIRLRIKEQITAFNYLVSQQVQLMQKNADTVNFVAQPTQVNAGRTLQPPQYYNVAAGGVPQPQQAGAAPVTFTASTGGFSSAQYAQLMTSLQGFDPNRPQGVPTNQGVTVIAPNQKSTNAQPPIQQKQQQQQQQQQQQPKSAKPQPPTPVLIQPALSSPHKQSPLALSVELNGDHLDLDPDSFFSDN